MNNKNFFDSHDDWESIIANNYKDASIFTIPNNMVDIPEFEFDSIQTDKKTLLIGKHVKTIGKGAFADTKFTLIEFEEGSQLNSIGEFAFNGCNQLKGDLLIPDTVEFIGNFAFNGARFNHVNIPPRLNGIFTLALSNLEFDEFIIPPYVEIIQLKGMSNWSINHDLVIPPTVKKLEILALTELNVKTVYIPYGIKLPKSNFEVIDKKDTLQLKRYYPKNYNTILNRVLKNKYN